MRVMQGRGLPYHKGGKEYGACSMLLRARTHVFTCPLDGQYIEKEQWLGFPTFSQVDIKQVENVAARVSISNLQSAAGRIRQLGLKPLFSALSKGHCDRFVATTEVGATDLVSPGILRSLLTSSLRSGANGT